MNELYEYRYNLKGKVVAVKTYTDAEKPFERPIKPTVKIRDGKKECYFNVDGKVFEAEEDDIMILIIEKIKTERTFWEWLTGK